MNKINFVALGPLPEIEVKYIQVGEVTIEVKPQVPYEQVLEGVQWAVNFIVDDRPFLSAPLHRIIADLSFIRTFTNFDFSSFDDFTITPQGIYEIYDILSHFDVFNKVKDFVSQSQLTFMFDTIKETCQALVDYRNSAAGIVDIISEKAKDTNQNVSEALNILNDPTKFEHVQKVMELMNPPK